MSANEEIEVTPEMTEVGFRVLEEAGIADALLRADRVLVGQIFLAMWRAAQIQASEREQAKPVESE